MISRADDIGWLIEDIKYYFLASDVSEGWRVFRAQYYTRMCGIYSPGRPFLG